MRISDLHKRIIAQRPNLLQNLVAYWNFNGSGVDSVSGITPILDTGVTYNNSSILGTSVSTTTNTSILRYAHRDDFNFTNGINDLPFSFSFWVFFTSFNTGFGNWLINKRNATTGGDEYQILYSASSQTLTLLKIQFNNNNILQAVRTPTNFFNINTWYHISITDGGTANFNDMNIYVNSVNVTNFRGNINGTYTRMPQSTISLGMLNANWGPGFDLRHLGRLDEVAIWKNRVLTQEEISFIYNNGAGRTYPL
jgi:hypothetical protein